MAPAAEYPVSARRTAADRGVGPGSVLTLMLAGLVLALMGAWGAGVVYWGPAINLSAPNDVHAWQWTGSHAVLNLIPGAVGCAAGLVIMAAAPVANRVGAHLWTLLASLTSIGAGAWFILGRPIYTLADPAANVLSLKATSLHQLIAVWSYALVPGLVLVAFGALVFGLTAYRPVVRSEAWRPSRVA